MHELKLRPIDLRIIESLREDPRSSVAKIAARWKLAESTVRLHLNRLVESGVVDFALVTNPLQFGYQLWVMVNIQTEPPKIRSVATQLEAVPEVYFVGITTGGYDIFAAAVFRSNDELLDFMTRRLARIPGIVRASTSSILELVKRGLAFGVGNPLIENGHALAGTGPAPAKSARRRGQRAAGRRPRRKALANG